MVLLVRTAPREDSAKPTDGMSVLLVDLRDAIGHGLTIKPIRTMINHSTTELFFDDLRVPVANLVGEEGKGFRYILDGMNAEEAHPDRERVPSATRGVLHRSRGPGMRGSGRCFGQADRRESGRAVLRSRAPTSRREAASLMVDRAARRFDAGLPSGTDANMAETHRGRCVVARGRLLHADVRGVWIRRGV